MLLHTGERLRAQYGEILGLRDPCGPGNKNHLTIVHPDLAPNASLVRSQDSFATWPPPGKDIVVSADED